jgi:hypothetical protein
MVKLALANLLFLIFSLGSFNATLGNETQASNPEFLIENECISLFLDLALGQIDFEEYNLLFSARCSVNLDCPDGSDYASVGCSGPSAGGCSSDEDSVTCSGHTTSCYCAGTELCEA